MTTIIIVDCSISLVTLLENSAKLLTDILFLYRSEGSRLNTHIATLLRDLHSGLVASFVVILEMDYSDK